MAQPSPAECSVFVQVYVDTAAAKTGSCVGVYMVDNRASDGSANEASARLDTRLSRISNICFQALNVDATAMARVSLESFGDSNAWGPSGLPEMWDGNAAIWTGQAESGGNSQPYSFTLQVAAPTPFQIDVTMPSLSVTDESSRSDGTGPGPSKWRYLQMATSPKVQTAVTIALDAQYLIAQQSGTPEKGIYMIDNQLADGSTGEGGLNLNTHCTVGDNISFQVIPITQLQGSDCAVVTGFDVSQGTVFGGSQGTPVKADLKGATPGSYWLGQAINKGTQPYTIYGTITQHGLHKLTRDISWGAVITCS